MHSLSQQKRTNGDEPYTNGFYSRGDELGCALDSIDARGACAGDQYDDCAGNGIPGERNSGIGDTAS